MLNYIAFICIYYIFSFRPANALCSVLISFKMCYLSNFRPVDIWAIGCLASEMLTGEPLFAGESDIDQLFHIVRCFGEIFKLTICFLTRI